MDRAACRGSAPLGGDKDLFFPGRGETSEDALLQFCFRCKVRAECKEYADRTDARTGVWGGERRTRSTHGLESEKRK